MDGQTDRWTRDDSINGASMAWRGKKNFQGSIGNTILTVPNAAYCYKRRSAVLLRVGRRVATFSLFRSGTGVLGGAPSRRVSGGMTPGKLLEFYV